MQVRGSCAAALAYPIDFHPAKCRVHPPGVCGRQLSIVDFIQHGGDSIEREKDLELGYEADAPRVASEPCDGAACWTQKGELLASRVDERHDRAGDEHHNTNDQPHQHCYPAPDIRALEALAGAVVQIVVLIGTELAPAPEGSERADQVSREAVEMP